MSFACSGFFFFHLFFCLNIMRMLTRGSVGGLTKEGSLHHLSCSSHLQCHIPRTVCNLFCLFSQTCFIPKQQQSFSVFLLVPTFQGWEPSETALSSNVLPYPAHPPASAATVLGPVMSLRNTIHWHEFSAERLQETVPNSYSFSFLDVCLSFYI